MKDQSIPNIYFNNYKNSRTYYLTPR